MILGTRIFLNSLLILATTAIYSQDYTWEELPEFPGLSRDDAVAFSIEDVIYVGTGNHGGFSQSNRFYALNTTLNSWTEMGEFPGVARQYGRAEVLNGKAYLLGGIDLFNNPLNDIWEFDPGDNSWRELAEFPGGVRWQAASFVIKDKIYFGTGRNHDIRYGDFWEFNPTINQWKKLADLPKLPCYETVSFSIFEAGYLGLGRDCTGVYLADFWRYEPSNDLWVKESDFPAGPRYYSKGESFNGFGFVGTGEDEAGIMKNDCWKFDPFTGKWSELPNLPGIARRGVSSTAISNKGVFFIGGLSEDFERLNTIYQLLNSNHLINNFKISLSRNNQTLRIRNLNYSESIRIFSLSGELVFESTVLADSIYIRTDSWASGMYVINYHGRAEKIILF